jgi:hypothetical protein
MEVALIIFFVSLSIVAAILMIRGRGAGEGPRQALTEGLPIVLGGVCFLFYHVVQLPENYVQLPMLLSFVLMAIGLTNLGKNVKKHGPAREATWRARRRPE